MRRPGRFFLAGAIVAIAGLTPGWASHVSAAGSTFYVSPSGSDTAGTGSSSAPYATIGHAVSAVPAGSTVTVEPGTYKEMVTVTQQVTLQSDSSKSNANTTIIDATGKDHGLVIQGPATAGTVVSGLTIENATQEGLVAVSTTNLTIENNVVSGNDTSTPPPEEVTEDTPDLEALHIMGVTNSQILNNVVQNNHDGGIYLTDEPGPTTGNTVAGNQVLNNAVDCGITLANHNPKAEVSNNIVKNNTSKGNGALGIGVFSPLPGGRARNNQILNNVSSDNGSAGIGMHGHAPGQDMSGTIIDGNTVSGNGQDLLPKNTGIIIAGIGTPITNTQITNNTIGKEDVGIVLLGAVARLAGNVNTAALPNIQLGFSKPWNEQGPPPPFITAIPTVTTVGKSTEASFTVNFTSTMAGQGAVYFGTDPGCTGLVQVATNDAGAGTTNHTVTVRGNELPGTIGDIGIQPGQTYYFEVVTSSRSGTEIGNGGGTCFAVTIPSV
jgi:parallel beta-helix repeat protein